MAPTVVFDKSASICHIEGAWQRWLAYGFIYLNRTSTHFTPPQEKTQPAHPPALTSWKTSFMSIFSAYLVGGLLKPDLALITKGGNGICFITV